MLACACQPSVGSPTPKAAADPLAAADAKLYAGDYDGAERAYRELDANLSSSAAKAHLAILLDYENRFAEAVTLANQAATAQADSVTLSRLTRTLDWSEDVTTAVATGSRAIKATPVDPIAHVYFSEALADSAHFAAARSELVVGEAAARDAYTRAEVEREWGNYYRGLGDILEELNHLQLAVKAQPDFPERVLELARYQYQQQRPAVARTLLAGLGKKHPRDYAVNVAAGDSASLNGDTATAEAFYRTALAIQPHAPAASLGLAQVDVAQKRDFNGAHDVLAASLQANPTASGVYYYLNYLDLLVLKTDPAKDLGTTRPQPAALDDARKLALDRVNTIRSQAGLPALVEAAPLAEAALAHAYFWLFNFGHAAVVDSLVHSEDPTLPGAFGADPLARSKHFGFAGARVAEVVSHAFLPSAAVDHWVDAVVKRYPLTDPGTGSVGYGQAQVGALAIQVLDLGQDQISRLDPVVYPVADQQGVPAAFLGNEVPDPAPNARYPTGYPITVQLGSGSALKIQTEELIDPKGQDLTGYVIDSSGGQLQADQWAVLPQDPLAGGKYTMKLVGTINGQAFQKEWSFTVAVS